jgi:hypothetical protein
VTLMTGTAPNASRSAAPLRLTWVADHLTHVLENSEADEASSTWTGLACPDHGLRIGSDVDNATLLRLADQGEIADLVWEALSEFTAEQGQLCAAAIQAHLSGGLEQGEHLWQQATALWAEAWSADYQVLELMQEAGLTRFSTVKPQRWVIASFGHHTSPHGLPHPHIHKFVIPALTASARMNGYQEALERGCTAVGMDADGARLLCWAPAITRHSA